ncbi:MAG: extracellular solute-binding protein, partial [Bacillota bacterium]|nr:extracellular solute-binding protein [Bacillota bacterium]
EEGTFQFLPWLLSAGGSMEKLDSKEAVKAFSFLADLIKDGSISKEVINRTQQDVMKEFTAGKTAMMINGSWQLPQISSVMKDMEYGVVKIPKDKKYSSVLGGENIAVVNGKNKKLALKFLYYVCRPENVKWYSNALGYFPPRKDIAIDDLLAGNPAMEVFADEIKYAQPRDPNPKWPEISRVISEAFQEDLTGAKTPESVAKDAQRKIDLILKQ